MVEIESIDDLICNVKEAMKSFFYTKTDSDSRYSQTTHNHDSRYYTESEIDTQMSGKAASNHTHTYDDTLNNSSTNAAQNKIIYGALQDKADVNHSHTTDTTLDGTSTNPVQNKIIKTALDGKASTSHTHSAATTSAAGFMSAADKTKLNGIDNNAKNTVVDAALDGTSTNPVQNKVIKSALDNKAGLTIASANEKGLLSAADKAKLDSITTGARAKKRTLGFLITSPKDSTNQNLITIDQGTKLKVELYDSENGGNIDASHDGIVFVANLLVHYLINNNNRSLTTTSAGAGFTVGLNPGYYTVHFSFNGSGNYYPVYRSIVLRVDAP